MAQTTVAPYGAWRSPISAELVAAGSLRFAQVQVDGEDVYWGEGRPAEGGRVALVRRTPDGRVEDVTPPPFSARTRVHEYGGGAYLAHAGALFFTNDADQRLYRMEPGGAPEPLTPAGPLRYADMDMDRARRRLLCVCERHPDGGGEPENFLAAVPLDGGPPEPLAQGRAFYAAPRLSPDGALLAWLAWDHPHMPWDAAELWLAQVQEDGALAGARQVAGGAGDSCCVPRWSPAGELHFAAERTGWWNLYRLRGAGTPAEAVEPVCREPLEAELGAPMWTFGDSTYAFDGPDRVICAYRQGGSDHLAWIDTATGALTDIPCPYTEIDYLQALGGAAVFLGGAPALGRTVVRYDPAHGVAEPLRAASGPAVDPGYLAAPQPVEFPSAGGRTAHGFFYPPQNRDYAAPAGELPPLLVMSHGGPTSAASSTLSLKVQFWTSRGVAVLDVNYGGSTGYGRAYRERLLGQWGVVDVDDCCAGAVWLARQGMADGARMAITGGSAGGFTTLAALTFRDVFKAGASYYGIGDLEAMERDTHKFESRYLDGLVAPYPERRDVFVERSPLHHVSALECPVVFFQGLEDKVVPPNQSEAMVAALRAKGVPVAYVAFPGEQHGFRRQETIVRSLSGELYFYSRVFGFPLAEPAEPLDIENLA